MPIIMTHRYFLVFPDGLTQEMDFPLEVRAGDLLPTELLQISPQPAGRYVVKRVEELETGQLPRLKRYHLERF